MLQRGWFLAAIWGILLFSQGCDQSRRASDITTTSLLPDPPAATFQPTDWPAWRGINGDGNATGPRPPIAWDAKTNVVWKTPIPGHGHSSPIVVGDYLFLTTADDAKRIQKVICIARESGVPRWTTEVHRGGFDRQAHPKNSQATPTMVSDGTRVYASFFHQEGIWLTALDLKGTILWSKLIGPFTSRFGYAPSPVLYGSYIIVAADHEDGGFLAAVHRMNGEIIWRRSRPATESYATPSVLKVDGKDQLVIAGGDYVRSYDPDNGEVLWVVQGTSQSCVGSPVMSEGIIIASGGYPGRETIAIRPQGTKVPEVVWRNKVSSYVPSLLIVNGYLYQVTDKGLLSCWDIKTGKRNWTTRLEGEVSSSPVACGDLIYLSNEGGVTFTIKANPQKYELLAENSIKAEEQLASPVISGGQIFLRIAQGTSDNRKEMLYCIGDLPTPPKSSVTAIPKP
ncbi:MAG: PQQ-binding-like beta-propeller repeat protein [Planctomycetales bacterium]